MIKKIIFLNFLIIFFIFINKSFAEDFYFEGEEIQVIGNGEILKSNKGIKITSTKHFSNRMFRIGDRILIKNYTTTGAGSDNNKFINFIWVHFP